jgi:hypothetical protein
VRANDPKVRANDIEKARAVDFRSHSVDFWSVVSANTYRMTFGATCYSSSIYGKIASNRSVIRDQKVAF